MIRVQEVSKEFITGNIKTLAVKNVNLVINAGDFKAIIGPSGSGKSTLIKLISGLIKPTSGNVIYGKHNLANLDLNTISKLRLKYIGQIFQDYRLIDNLSVMENVLLPIKLANNKITASVKNQANDIFAKLGILHRVNHKPDTLSGGEKQRVGIARSLITNPSIIIADEPTGNLDKGNTQEIIEILSDLNSQGISILVVTHDQKIAKIAKEVIQFENGVLR